MGALIMDFFRLLDEAVRTVGGWAATAMRALMASYFSLLLVSLLWLIATVTIGSLGSFGHSIMPWLGIVYPPIILMLLMSERSINAAALAVGVDLVLNKLRGKIHFHLPTHPKGMIEYTGTGTFEDLVFLKFLVRSALAVIASMMVFIFILAAMPQWPSPYFSGMIILALFTWGIITLNRNEWMRLSGYAISGILLFAILGSLLPHLAHVQKIQSEAVFVNKNREIANQHEDNLRNQAETELNKTYGEIAVLQNKNMQRGLTESERKALDLLIQKRDRILGARTVNPSSSASSESWNFVPAGWQEMTWKNRFVWALGWIILMLFGLAFIGTVIWFWRNIAGPAPVIAAATGPTVPGAGDPTAGSAATTITTKSSTSSSAATSGDKLGLVEQIMGVALILAVLIFGQPFWNQIMNMSDMPKYPLILLLTFIAIVWVYAMVARDRKRAATAGSLMVLAIMLYVAGVYNMFDSLDMYQRKLGAASRMGSTEREYKPRSEHVFASAQPSKSPLTYVDLGTLTEQVRWHDTGVIPATRQTLVISGYAARVIGSDVRCSQPMGLRGYQQHGPLVEGGNLMQIIVLVDGVAYPMTGDEITIQSATTTVKIAVNGFPLEGGFYYRFK